MPTYASHFFLQKLHSKLEDNLQLPDGSIYSGESDAEFAVSNVSQLSQLKDFEGLGYIRHDKITLQSNLSC